MKNPGRQRHTTVQRATHFEECTPKVTVLSLVLSLPRSPEQAMWRGHSSHFKEVLILQTSENWKLAKVNTEIENAEKPTILDPRPCSY